MERDTGFCSGADEDKGFYSHTDANDDRADIKVRGVSVLRNVRKCSKPRRLVTDLPGKKRKIDIGDSKTSPFRPWEGSLSPPALIHTDANDDRADIKVRGVSVLRNVRKCSKPRRLDTDLPAKKRKIDIGDSKTSPFRPWEGLPSPPAPQTRQPSKLIPSLIRRPLLDEKPPLPLLVHIPHLLLTSPRVVPLQSRLLVQKDESLSLVSKKKPEPRFPQVPSRMVHEYNGDKTPSERSPSEFKIDALTKADRTLRVTESPRSKASQAVQGLQQRNYKNNMTRERRLKTNAQQRARYHTLNAAFDTLRHSIPAYSHNQKLSKFNVLRIASSYIMTLSRLTGEDCSADQNQPSVSECVSSVSRTLVHSLWPNYPNGGKDQ